MNSKLILNGHCTSWECVSLLKMDVSSLTDKHTLDWRNPSLVWNRSSSECPQISVTQTDGQFQLKKTNKHSSISRNLTLVWPLSPAHLQLLWMKCKQRSTHLTESALPSFTYTANGYDTDTTAGTLCLQEKFGQGVSIIGRTQPLSPTRRLRLHGTTNVEILLVCPGDGRGWKTPMMGGVNVVERQKSQSSSD